MKFLHGVLHVTSVALFTGYTQVFDQHQAQLAVARTNSVARRANHVGVCGSNIRGIQRVHDAVATGA